MVLFKKHLNQTKNKYFHNGVETQWSMEVFIELPKVLLICL